MALRRLMAQSKQSFSAKLISLGCCVFCWDFFNVLNGMKLVHCTYEDDKRCLIRLQNLCITWGADWNDNCNMNRWECEDGFFAGGRGFFPRKTRRDAPWRCLHNGYPSARVVPGVAPPQHLHQQSDGPSGRDPASISELWRSQRVQQMRKHSDSIRCFFLNIWPNNPQKLMTWDQKWANKRIESWAKYAK